MGKEKAFVIISFNKKFKNVYDQAIKPAIESNDLIAQKADGEDKAIREIYKDIAEKLANSKIVIIDISKVEDDSGDLIDLSNVYYELGLASAINKRCIFITRDSKDIPFDLKNRSALTYDADDFEKLKKDLAEQIKMGLQDTPIDFFEGFDVFNCKGVTSTPEQTINNINFHISEACESGILKYLYEIYVCIGEDVKPYTSNNVSELQLLRLSSLKLIKISQKDTSKGPVSYIAMTEKGLNYIFINKALIESTSI